MEIIPTGFMAVNMITDPFDAVLPTAKPITSAGIGLGNK
jgi:hypothetical protein